MFFSKFRKIKPKPPIEIAFQMVLDAMTIACGYYSNKRFIPTENDVKDFRVFVEEMELGYAAVLYIAENLEQRSKE